MFGEVVDGIEGRAFEDALTALKRERGAALDTDLTADDLVGLVETYRKIYLAAKGSDFPQAAAEQLMRAVGAVFDSWNTPRAQVYRRANDIPDSLGTAVNVVQMVFGNKGERSGTGVAFTRNPSTGAKEVYGEFLVNAQGEDVVAGIRTPQPVESMGQLMPDAYEQLLATMRRLEDHYRDMQDVEFTVEDDVLYMLQTRAAKRTAAAAVRAAVEMVGEGAINREEAIVRVDPSQLDQLLHPRIDPGAAPDPIARGLNASPGAASGAIVFDADTAVERAKSEPVLLVRYETTPDDIHGMIASQGILTVHGGMTSHAAVVARGMGKPCVAGCEGLSLENGTARIGSQELREGDVITIDGGTGSVYLGRVELVAPELGDDFQTLLGWADAFRRLHVRTNADTLLMPPGPASSGPRGSDSVVPSTCSSARSGCRSCRR
jgi:pyruvate,orthophosphate dikinase